MAAWLEAEKQRAFDWQTAPLLRFQVHRFGTESFQLTLSFHHAIADGWSVATMLAELFAQYGALLEGDSRAVPAAPELTYRDFVALEQASVESEETRDVLGPHAGGPRRASSCRDCPRHPARPGVPGQLGVQTVPLSEELSAGLKSLAQRAGVPLKSVLLAAHVRVMGLVGNQADVLTGLVANSRPGRVGRRTGAGPVPQHAALAARADRRQLAGTVPGRVPGRAGTAAPPPLPHGPPATKPLRPAPVRDGLQLQPLPCLSGRGGSGTGWR